MKIIVRVQDNYGKTSVYPVCKRAKMFAEIAGTRTLTLKTIKIIKSLGYEIDVESINFEGILNEF